MGAGPSQIGPDRKVLPGVFLAALNALFQIEILFLQGFEQSRRGECGVGRLTALAVEERDAPGDPKGRGADVEPNQPFGWSADGDAELVDGESAGEVLDVGRTHRIDDLLELFAAVDDADGVEVETLDFGGGEACGRPGGGAPKATRARPSREERSARRAERSSPGAAAQYRI